MTLLPFPIPKEAVDAVDLELWDSHYAGGEDDRRKLAEDCIRAALPYLRFAPTGDNHHDATACPYCTPPS